MAAAAEVVVRGTNSLARGAGEVGPGTRKGSHDVYFKIRYSLAPWGKRKCVVQAGPAGMVAQGVKSPAMGKQCR